MPGRTPVYGAGSHTPMYGAGSQTPMHDVQDVIPSFLNNLKTFILFRVLALLTS